MSGGLRRRAADRACRLLIAALPAPLRAWGWAVRCETAAIGDDGRALLFALHSLCGLLPRAIAARLFQPLAAVGSGGASLYATALRRPRALGIICAVSAVALGLVHLALVGAPGRYLAINVAALVVGLTLLGVIGRGGSDRAWSGVIALIAAALMATALLGQSVAGAARWASVGGGLSLQPGLMLVPAMLVAFARRSDARSAAGVIAAVIAVAVQPDRGVAGMLALALATLAVLRPARATVIAALAGVAGLAVTFARADIVPATAYVDWVLTTTFAVHAGAGLAVLGGAALLLVPAVVGWLGDPARRAPCAVFGAVWGGALAAAVLGDYPTPLVGYGGSAIIGYALSLLAVPRIAGVATAPAAPAADIAAHMPADRQFRLGIA